MHLSHTWLLGHQSPQRLYLTQWLMNTIAYGLLLILYHYCWSVDLVDYRYALVFWLSIPVASAAFFVALRSGWSGRLKDPSLTSLQSLFGIVMCGLGYLLMPEVREIFFMALPSLLMLGAFNLSPRKCRQMGWQALLVMAVTFAVSVEFNPQNTSLRREIVMFLANLILVPFVADMVGRLSSLRDQLRIQKQELNEALERNLLLARQDSLTLLPNRRHAQELLEHEERRARRQGLSICVCLFDIDNFKRVNDTFGHPAGDAVLCLLAQQGTSTLRSADVLARWGGEEFLLVMPETTLPEGLLVVQRLREHLDQETVWAQQPHLRVTFSSGIAVHQLQETMTDTLSRADVALYQAKQQGRNCTVLA